MADVGATRPRSSLDYLRLISARVDPSEKRRRLLELSQTQDPRKYEFDAGPEPTLIDDPRAVAIDQRKVPGFGSQAGEPLLESILPSRSSVSAGSSPIGRASASAQAARREEMAAAEAEAAARQADAGQVEPALDDDIEVVSDGSERGSETDIERAYTALVTAPGYAQKVEPAQKVQQEEQVAPGVLSAGEQERAGELGSRITERQTKIGELQAKMAQEQQEFERGQIRPKIEAAEKRLEIAENQRQQHLTKLEGEHRALVQEIDDMPPAEPSLWSSGDTGKNIMRSVGILLMALGAGGPEGAQKNVQFFQQLANNEVEKQKRALEKKRGKLDANGTLYERALVRFGDERMAAAAAHQSFLRKMQQSLEYWVQDNPKQAKIMELQIQNIGDTLQLAELDQQNERQRTFGDKAQRATSVTFAEARKGGTEIRDTEGLKPSERQTMQELDEAESKALEGLERAGETGGETPAQTQDAKRGVKALDSKVEAQPAGIEKEGTPTPSTIEDEILSMSPAQRSALKRRVDKLAKDRGIGPDKALAQILGKTFATQDEKKTSMVININGQKSTVYAQNPTVLNEARLALRDGQGLLSNYNQIEQIIRKPLKSISFEERQAVKSWVAANVVTLKNVFNLGVLSADDRKLVAPLTGEGAADTFKLDDSTLRALSIGKQLARRSMNFYKDQLFTDPELRKPLTTRGGIRKAD